MTRQNTTGENISIPHILKMAYPEYIKNYQNSISKQKLKLKMGKDLNIHFNKEDIQWQISTLK